MTNACGCLNGGKCRNAILRICECTSGFEGEFCEETYIDFTFRNKFGDNGKVIIIVAVVLFVLFASIICFFLTWRRIKSIRKRRLEMCMNRNRRQSKATIEGSCVMPGWDSSSQCSRNSAEVMPQIVACQGNGENGIKPKNTDLLLNEDTMEKEKV